MAAGSSHYVFRSHWRLGASREAVFAALVDVPGYPQWWHQVHAARQVDEHSGELRCRSLLPYDLVFTVTREIEDAAAGVLRARLDGDLVGWSQWSVDPSGDAVFDEDVTVSKSLVRAAGVLARPALRFNHDRMMRAGERGLRAWLAP